MMSNVATLQLCSGYSMYYYTKCKKYDISFNYSQLQCLVVTYHAKIVDLRLTPQQMSTSCIQTFVNP